MSAASCRRCGDPIVQLIDEAGEHVGWISAGKVVNAGECSAAPGHTHALAGTSGPIEWAPNATDGATTKESTA